MKKAIQIMAVLFCCWGLALPSAASTDYIDNINNQKYGDGHHVIYEMNIGAFTAAGTFQAAQGRLSELKRIGIDIVWLMPIYPRGGGINSPYAAKNFQQVNPAYGTISDLKAFVAAAHELDMQVWLDWVPNHTATDADWVTQHPEYYKKSGGQFVHPNNYGDVYQLDYGNSSLQKAMTDCLKFWIDQADIDGFRCDYVSSPDIPSTYWQTAIPEVKSYKTGKTVTFLAEADLTDNNNSRLKSVGFDYDYAWQFQSQLLNFGSTGNAAARPKAFANTLLGNQGNVSFGRMNYLTNHDQNYEHGSLASMYGDNRYPLTVLYYTIAGMPLIYNGQEIGGNEKLDYFKDSKVNWTNADDKMLNTIRTLSALKHSVPALADGKTKAENHSVSWLTVTNNTAVLAYTCKAPANAGDTGEGTEALVLLNFSASQASATVTGLTAGEYGLWLNSETASQGTSRKAVNLNATHTFTLPAKGYQVYVKGHFSEEAIPEKEYTAYTPAIDSENEVSIFLETQTEAVYNVWTWGDLGGGEAYTTAGAWPGDAMTLMGKNDDGKLVYKYVQTKTASLPQSLIVTRYAGGSETKRLWDGVPFVNHGYYIEDTNYSATSLPTAITATGGTSGIRNIDRYSIEHSSFLLWQASPNVAERNIEHFIYDLSGRRVGRLGDSSFSRLGDSSFSRLGKVTSPNNQTTKQPNNQQPNDQTTEQPKLKKGIYILGGRKYVIR